MLGQMHAASFASDPKHLGFVLARYHFVARMLMDYGEVLEIGCGDCTGARVVKPCVRNLEGCDISLDLVPADGPIPVSLHSFNDGPLPTQRGGPWDAIYMLDVLEHIHPRSEDRVLKNVRASLRDHGTFIVGTPSLESQPYASRESREHHVNCKTEAQLRGGLINHFRNVFLFGMNDATLHTGFGPMCHYRLALCTGPFTV